MGAARLALGKSSLIAIDHEHVFRLFSWWPAAPTGLLHNVDRARANSTASLQECDRPSTGTLGGILLPFPFARNRLSDFACTAFSTVNRIHFT